MDIWMIWAMDPTDTSETVWLVDAWDDESMVSNHDGWVEAIAKAESEFGARYVRIAKTTVNLDPIVSSFRPVVV